LRTADETSEFLLKWRFCLRKPPFYPLNYGDAVKAKVRRMKEEVQRSRIRKLKENPEVRFQRSEVTGE